ncbi:hypothetical protein WOLCODRAFT_157672 [Wolfiporia cocos MD-104 SS10]|uniref:Uncharacterized protein n=1 Tax=Wolfiporia cocos (strain MD-104) TaxID=742152 RepID=A0A2H3J401_WOLCO|nr:hypothetical protein WOLCODRAFT_157672 [Wolfiporia cocos MD-104 SS10]
MLAAASCKYRCPSPCRAQQAACERGGPFVAFPRLAPAQRAASDGLRAASNGRPAASSAENALPPIAWNGNHGDLFHSLPIVRDAQPASAEPPENPVVLRWDKDPTSAVALLQASRLSSILVRDEYPKMLQDIIDDAVLGRKYEDSNDDDDSNTDKSNGAMNVDIDAHPFHNPFDKLPHDGSSAAGTIVIGTPGIG